MTEDEEIGDRIRALRTEVLNINQTEFARQIGGVTRGAVGNWELGKGIKRENLRKIADRFGISLDWLATSRGPDPRDGHVRDYEYVPLDAETGGEISPDAQGFTRNHWRPTIPGAIPELDVEAGAGEGTVGKVIVLPMVGGTISAHEVVAEWPLPVSWLREVGSKAENTIIVPIRGDSMVPNYMPGDRVLVDLSQDTLQVDGVYLISYDMQPPQIKRLQRVPLTVPPRVSIKSDNQAYDAYEVEVDRIRIHGRVCAYVGRR